jgi:hypothetical protein
MFVTPESYYPLPGDTVQLAPLFGSSANELLSIEMVPVDPDASRRPEYEHVICVSRAYAVWLGVFYNTHGLLYSMLLGPSGKTFTTHSMFPVYSSQLGQWVLSWGRIANRSLWYDSSNILQRELPPVNQVKNDHRGSDASWC